MNTHSFERVLLSEPQAPGTQAGTEEILVLYFFFSSALFLTPFPSKSLDSEPWMVFAFMERFLFSLSSSSICFLPFTLCNRLYFFACLHHSEQSTQCSPMQEEAGCEKIICSVPRAPARICVHVCMPLFHPESSVGSKRQKSADAHFNQNDIVSLSHLSRLQMI